jgi:hypothetical protein
VNLSVRQEIAEKLLGVIRWESLVLGYTTCPGIARHTTGDGHRDCRITLDGAPTCFCFHASCEGIIAGLNHELRSRIGKAEGLDLHHLPRQRGGQAGNEEPEFILPPPPEWPAPAHERAFRGLAGDVVLAIEPHSESDPHAVLLMFLAAFGNLIGPTAHFIAEGRKHPVRLCPVVVGETSKSRKGSAWSALLVIFNRLAEDWVKKCTDSGLSSGEGLIARVCDRVEKTTTDKHGVAKVEVLVEGVEDKRLLVVEEEFSSVLKVAARDGNTLSDLLRKAWDHGNLTTLTKQSLRATNAHVTLIGHVTHAELKRLLSSTDGVNGFANRFAWCCARRSKLLPDGGSLHQQNLNDLVHLLNLAVAHGRFIGELRKTAAATDFWRRLYPILTKPLPGLLGAITNRAEAQVMRLAAAYAILDRANAIAVEHIQSGLAVWDYCLRSAAFIFGDSLGDKLADFILGELECAGPSGLAQSAIRDRLDRNPSSKEIGLALQSLATLGLVTSEKVPPTEGRGRPTTVWKACPDAINALNARSGGLTPLSAFIASQPPESESSYE